MQPTTAFQASPFLWLNWLTEMARFGCAAGALAPSYGLAESTCAVTVPEPGCDLIADESGNAVVGEPIPGMSVRIESRDEATTQDAGHEVGEF